VSLLGRLEDLSLTDIVQIVFLSRRTGVLEIIDDRGRHTVLFRQGLIVNASSPEHPRLRDYLERSGLITPGSTKAVEQMETSGIPFGTVAVEMNLLSTQDLASAIRGRILSVVAPLLNSREGEFNFILSESMNVLDIEYEPDALFKEGGLSPQKIIGAAEGEKIKPLRGLEESLKAGKALLRSSTPVEPAPKHDLGLGQNVAPASAGGSPAKAGPTNGVRFPTRDEFTALEEDVTLRQTPRPTVTTQPPREDKSNFKVAGGLFQVESPEAAFRNVVLFETNPMIRVAAKRAFAKKSVTIFQFGSHDDVRASIADLFRANSFFVTFLELTDEDRAGEGPAVRILQQIKRRNPRLPVVMIDNEADLRRRHALLLAGADLYLTKPNDSRLQPGAAQDELNLFADELVLFAERAFQQWEQLTGTFGADAGKRFYEMAEKETIDRTFSVLKQLINELSNPEDIGQVSATILRLAAEYLDRGALFMTGSTQFIGLGGFGSTGGGEDMDTRIKRLRLSQETPSILRDVAQSGDPHRGKMRRNPTNVDLIDHMGGLLPTEVIALPILHGEKTIGILYGDNAEHRTPLDSTTGLEIFLMQAGYAFGNAVFATERGGSGGL
jgi:CheY-like chemotaxis protein